MLLLERRWRQLQRYRHQVSVSIYSAGPVQTYPLSPYLYSYISYVCISVCIWTFEFSSCAIVQDFLSLLATRTAIRGKLGGVVLDAKADFQSGVFQSLTGALEDFGEKQNPLT